MWLQASDATPYWLLLEGSKGLLSITRENGTDAGILSKNDDGTWRNAFGTLAAGWYHIQFSLSDDALGASTTGTVSGQFGIPTPSSIVILALGSAMATPRRRN
jgi:hypothetical protein